MSLLKKLVVIGICVGTVLHAEWNPGSLYDENQDSTLILNNPEYTNLKTQVTQSLTNSWCSEEKINLLMDLALLTHPKICVEIGAFTGSSVLPIAATLKYLGSGEIFAIDAWSNTEAIKHLTNDDPNRTWWSQVDMKAVHSSFQKLTRTWSLKRVCKEIYKSSEQAIHYIPAEIDFLHLDGDYSETGALQDVELYLPKVKIGGYILLSNVYVVINGKQPKIQAFMKLLDTCDIIEEIENGNACLFKKTIESSISSLHGDLDGEINNTSKKACVIGGLLGQLGNKMFEIAAASALAWDNDAEPCFPDLLPCSNEYTHVFFRCDRDAPKNPISLTWSAALFEYQPIPYQPNMKLEGYLQNERYFKHHRNRILELFEPHPNDLRYIQKKYSEILAHSKSVSVHLRYYYQEKPDEEFFIQYEKEYYEKAMNLFPNDSIFIVVSDNIPFAKENIPCTGRNVIFIEKEPFYIDFYLQTLCKNNIISNSTFSWWGAWLNKNENKIVVRPKEWSKGYPDMEGPNDWIKVEAKGLYEKRKTA
jgi:hypothetical protein